MTREPKLLRATVTVKSGTASTKHVVLGSTQAGVDRTVAEIVRDALRKGCTVRFADGREVWEHAVVVRNPGLEGSAAYIWREDGLALHRRVRYTKSSDGAISEEDLGSCWRKW